MRAFLPYRERTENGLSAPWAHIWKGRAARIYAHSGWVPRERVEAQIRGGESTELWRGTVPCAPGTGRDEYVLDFSGVDDSIFEEMISAWVWFV